jgi:hypothetical protein
LFGIVVDLHHHAGLVLELVDGVLELLIENEAISDDDDRIEYFSVLRVMQAGEAMGQPGDAVAFAASGRMPDQVVLTSAGRSRVGDEFADGIDLVVAGEDEALLLVRLVVP